MTTDFDAIIVGSGFGGSVMAYRLAEAGLRVCVLERGKAYPPGSFARSPHALGRNFWDPSEGLHGLFDIWSFRGTEAVVASGLGGGSLIYANVLIRKPPQWFVDRDPRTGAQVPWPITRDDLDPHYDRVEQILNGQEFPLGAAAAYQAPKTLALQWAAGKRGITLPGLTVTATGTYDGPRFSRLQLTVASPAPAGVIEGLVQPALRVCYVSNTLAAPPPVEVTVAAPEPG